MLRLTIRQQHDTRENIYFRSSGNVILKIHRILLAQTIQSVVVSFGTTVPLLFSESCPQWIDNTILSFSFCKWRGRKWRSHRWRRWVGILYEVSKRQAMPLSTGTTFYSWYTRYMSMTHMIKVNKKYTLDVTSKNRSILIHNVVALSCEHAQQRTVSRGSMIYIGGEE